tara:strand:+ start:6426 stop:7256 length:831 start_codon:yes stop_codon:yes gene_type:complete
VENNNIMTNLVSIDNLLFKYDNKIIFNNLSLELTFNKCYVLSGLNGSGKSTILKILAGKTLAEINKVKLLNKDPFRDTSLNKDITFINNDWGMKSNAFSGTSPLQSSMKVKDMMQQIKLDFPDRNKELLSVLKINEEWRLNAVSDGQRKRIQIYLNLIKPFKICLLDEITVNLDLLVKDRLMQYLKKESIIRQCSIIYVTHIFDGLNEWCSDLIYLKKNKEISIIPSSEVKDIYTYLLHSFQSEETIEDEKEDINIEINSKNAGGYSHGVLINYKI